MIFTCPGSNLTGPVQFLVARGDWATISFKHWTIYMKSIYGKWLLKLQMKNTHSKTESSWCQLCFMTTNAATSDEKFGIMMLFNFHWMSCAVGYDVDFSVLAAITEIWRQSKAGNTRENGPRQWGTWQIAHTGGCMGDGCQSRLGRWMADSFRENCFVRSSYR